MYGYIDSNGNKHLLSGQQDIPQYTMEQYTALSVKPDIWVCTNYDSSSEYGIDSANVRYDNDNSVKDMLDKMCYRLIASSPSGKTYAQQLTEIATTFNALSKTQKATAVLCLSDEIFKCVDSKGRFVKMDVSGSSVIFSGFDVTNKTYHYAIASFTITDGSSLVASSDMELYILGK